MGERANVDPNDSTESFRIGAPNIFLDFPDAGLEDGFTSSWHYLLDSILQLAQAAVDRLADTAGLTSSRLVRVEDHPTGTLADRPDFFFCCDAFDTACEHKLDSPLGER